MGCLSIMTCLNSVDWPPKIVPHFTPTLHFQYFLKKHKKTIKRQMCGGWKAEIICNGFETLFWMLQNRQQPRRGLLDLYGGSREVSHQPLFQHVSLSGSTTDSRVWQHHHYPIACHLLSGVFYIFSALFVLSGKYNDISKNHTTSFCFVL